MADGIKSEVLLVTPAMAREWLTRNPINRNYNEAHARKISRDMSSGRWILNGESLKFSANGDLLDGQHRLSAIALSDTAVEIMVVTGLPAKSQTTMDSGRKRSASDALALSGQANSMMIAAILRCVWAWDKGDYKFTSGTPTTPELVSLFEAHPEIARSAEIASRVRRGCPALPPSVVGAAHHIFSRIDGETAVWFFQRLEDGVLLPAGHPILVLRDRAVRDQQGNIRVVQAQKMYYLVKSWNAVRENKPLLKIVYKSDSDMPLPV